MRIPIPAARSPHQNRLTALVAPTVLAFPMNAISPHAANDGWALGTTVPSANHTFKELTFHYDGTRWQQMASLVANQQVEGDRIFATGPDEAWQSYSNASNTDSMLHSGGVALPRRDMGAVRAIVRR